LLTVVWRGALVGEDTGPSDAFHDKKVCNTFLAHRRDL